MVIFDFILLSICIIFLVFLAYYFFLAVAGFWPAEKKHNKNLPKNRLTIIVPAHNEEKVIANTLTSLKQIDYPQEFVNIVVIADNCKDRTAAIVRSFDMECLVRNDTANPGKGQALAWAFSILLKRNDGDAFVIVDADTIVESNLLAVMNNYLNDGANVIQSYYDVLKPANSPMSSLIFLGFTISRNLKYRGRSRLGWSVNLVGNGMCFSRDIIERFGWGAFSISEDLEYQLQLLMNGISVVFVPETKVYGEMASSFRGSHRQRSRWDIGKYRLRNHYVPLLFVKGFKERKMPCFDAILELIIPPYTIYAGISFLLFVIYLMLNGPTGFQFYLWIFLTGGIFIYTLIGLIIAKAKFRVYFNLLYIPLFIIWRIFIAFGSLFAEGKTWVKTDRA